MLPLLLPALRQGFWAGWLQLAQPERAFLDANLDYLADAAIRAGVESGFQLL